MHTHADPRIHHAGMGGAFQHQHRQVIGGVIAVSVHAAYGQALASETAAVAHSHTSLIL